MRPGRYWHHGAHICEAITQVIQNQWSNKFRISFLEGRINHWQSCTFLNITTVKVAWNGSSYPPTPWPPAHSHWQDEIGINLSSSRFIATGRGGCRGVEESLFSAQVVWKGLQEVSAMAVIVRGRTGWRVEWNGRLTYSFPPVWFQQKPWLSHPQS